MYSCIYILVFFAYASNAFFIHFENLGKFVKEFKLKDLDECIFGFEESSCKYAELNVAYNIFKPNGEIQQMDLKDTSQCPNPNFPVKIIIHGWHNSPLKQWVKNVANTYLLKGSYNVIAVDWSQPAAKISYFASAVYTQCVGNMVGEFLLDYLAKCGFPVEDIHIIGHSLGAHLAGFAGKYVAKQTKYRKVGRITGLDMAGPCFRNHDSDQRLYKGDAHYVDVYHTDALFGSNDNVGDYDIYFNEGIPPQPGCEDEINKWEGFKNGLIHCSHARAYEYFMESIYSNEFIASKCKIHLLKKFEMKGPKNVIIGENLSNSTSPGTYCLETNSKPPYAQSA